MKNWHRMAQLFIVGAKDMAITPEFKELMKKFPVSGIALFNSPFDGPENIWSNTEAALEKFYEFIVYTQRKAFLCVDQEGGRVRRLRNPFVNLPAAQKMAQAYREGKTKEVERVYAIAAKQMALSHIALDFAPCCDLFYPETTSVIGDRSFGDFDTVIKMAGLFCDSFEKNGVHTTLKHCPGHGPTKFDSHEKVATVFKSEKELMNEDFKVFEKLSNRTSAIMTAHIAFEDQPHHPLSMDRKFVKEMKRKIGSHLLWTTDDLVQMKAVSEMKPWVKAYDAEYDFILTCGTAQQSVVAIEDTIRHAEKIITSFPQEEALENRWTRSSTAFLEEDRELLPFKKWKEEIIRLGREAEEILGEIQTYVA